MKPDFCEHCENYEIGQRPDARPWCKESNRPITKGIILWDGRPPEWCPKYAQFKDALEELVRVPPLEREEK
jgi:hypothetical protein